MRFVPYEYQRYCTEYIKTHPIAALFLDMGLGKTVITLSAIKDLMLETFEVSKVLIIAPLRVARDTWPAEIEKWDHLKGLDISVIVGDVKTRIAAVHHPAMIYIVNRENIKWLVEYYEKNGMRWDFSMIVIDELSSFKNYQSQRFKFLRKVRPYVKRWVGLTGTPSSNGLMDLWAEIGILDGGERLGKFIGRYREAYFKAGALNPATGIVFQYVPRQGGRGDDLSADLGHYDFHEGSGLSQYAGLCTYKVRSRDEHAGKGTLRYAPAGSSDSAERR